MKGVGLTRGRAFGLGALALLCVGFLAVAPRPAPALISTLDSGRILVADSVDSQIESVDPATGNALPVSTGGDLVFPADETFAKNGDVLVVDRDAFGGSGGIIRIDKANMMQSAVSSNAVSDAAGGQQLFNDPISIDRKKKSLYVTDFASPPKV